MRMQLYHFKSKTNNKNTPGTIHLNPNGTIKQSNLSPLTAHSPPPPPHKCQKCFTKCWSHLTLKYERSVLVLKFRTQHNIALSWWQSVSSNNNTQRLWRNRARKHSLLCCKRYGRHRCHPAVPGSVRTSSTTATTPSASSSGIVIITV